MWIIYKKEFLELIRDKRTLIFTILLPTLILPAIFGGFSFMVHKISQKAAEEELTYVVQNATSMPRIVSELEKQESFKRIDLENVDQLTSEELKQKIQEKAFKFAVIIPTQGNDLLNQGLQAQVELHFNNASPTNKIFQRVQSAIDSINEAQQKKLLAKFNFSEENLKGLVKPINIERVNTADAREDIGEKIGFLVPYVLIIIILTGAMYPALDLGVGEKERGTLETLLLTPIERSSIVIAKFLVIFTTGFLSVFLTLASCILWALIALSFFAVKFLSDFSDTIAIADVFMIFLMLVPIAAIFASLLLSVSIYAKNFKEAQNYISPLMLFIFVPVVFSILPGVQLDSTWAWIPITNVSLAIKEIVKGTIDYKLMGIIFASTSIVAAIFLFFTTRWFNKESVLFRT